MGKYRQANIQDNLQLRSKIIRAIHEFFSNQGVLEVETPCRIPAPAPEAHIDAQTSGVWFLHTSPELCMKRLLAAGYPRIYQICKSFRQKERGQKHLPEFSLLEWYSAGINYLNMMDQCEDLIRFVARAAGFGDSIVYQGENIDLKAPWNRMSVADAFEKFASIPLKTALAEDRFDEAIACEIEPNLGRKKPLFLYDYPASKGAFARLKPDNPQLAERFELYMGGVELCNAFTEITDPEAQKARFKTEQDQRRTLGKQTYPAPEMFLTALQDMPAASGNALGIDRLIMIFADTARIDDVVAFTPEEL